MTEEEQNKALLPSGFSDLLPPQAGQEADAITDLLSAFLKFGYRRVKPPLVEFEEGLFAPGPGSALIRDTFRVMDPVSHRMMGVRSDITAQIARIASSRLQKEERPLRLAYANDVLRTKGSQQRTARQFSQVGCEIIGPEDDQADIEICAVALAGLAALDIGPLTLDLNLPRLPDLIFEDTKTSEEKKKEISKALADRDVEALQTIGGKAAKIFEGLLSASGPAEEAMKALSKVGTSRKAKAQIKKMQTVYEGIRQAIEELGLQDISLTIDVLETRGLEYHCGVAFGFFADDARAPLGRGGCYDIVFGESSTESATGFTLYMDTVCGALGAVEQKQIVFVPASESWGAIQSLQEEGWIVVRGTGQNTKPNECTHEYKNGQVKEL